MNRNEARTAFLQELLLGLGDYVAASRPSFQKDHYVAGYDLDHLLGKVHYAARATWLSPRDPSDPRATPEVVVVLDEDAQTLAEELMLKSTTVTGLLGPGSSVFKQPTPGGSKRARWNVAIEGPVIDLSDARSTRNGYRWSIGAMHELVSGMKPWLNAR